jgi:hypothetical protein
MGGMTAPASIINQAATTRIGDLRREAAGARLARAVRPPNRGRRR